MRDEQHSYALWLELAALLVAVALIPAGFVVYFAASQAPPGHAFHFWRSPQMMVVYALVLLALPCFAAAVRGLSFPGARKAAVQKAHWSIRPRRSLATVVPSTGPSGLARQPLRCPHGHTFEAQVTDDGRQYVPTKPSEMECPSCGVTNGHTQIGIACPVEWPTTATPKYRVMHATDRTDPPLSRALVGDYLDYAKARAAAEQIAGQRPIGVVTIETGNEVITTDPQGRQRSAYWGALPSHHPEYRFEEIPCA